MQKPPASKKTLSFLGGNIQCPAWGKGQQYLWFTNNIPCPGLGGGRADGHRSASELLAASENPKRWVGTLMLYLDGLSLAVLQVQGSSKDHRGSDWPGTQELLCSSRAHTLLRSHHPMTSPQVGHSQLGSAGAEVLVSS